MADADSEKRLMRLKKDELIDEARKRQLSEAGTKIDLVIRNPVLKVACSCLL